MIRSNIDFIFLFMYCRCVSLSYAYLEQAQLPSIRGWLVLLPLRHYLRYSLSGLHAVACSGTQPRLKVNRRDTDVVNTVCALVVSLENASALKPFLISLLCYVLHTQNTWGNMDTSDRDPHPALLVDMISNLLQRRQ